MKNSPDPPQSAASHCNTSKGVRGLHHLTAISGDARHTLHFYRDLLGLRLVKKTVNFDDPYTYHLYFGDEEGNPGSLMTFFPWQGIPDGVPGYGMVERVSLLIPHGSWEFWQQRLEDAKVSSTEEEFHGERVLAFSDPDGLSLALVEGEEGAPHAPVERSAVPADKAILGMAGVSMAVAEDDMVAARDVLQKLMDTEPQRDREGWRFWLAESIGGRRNHCDLRGTAGPSGRAGSGTVHHVAFRTRDEDHSMALRAQLAEMGIPASGLVERLYFRSVYFRIPGGILLELATDGPGFTVDEPMVALGSSLVLPPQHEGRREQIEARLPSLEPAAESRPSGEDHPSDPRVLHQAIYYRPASERLKGSLLALHGTGGSERDLPPLLRTVAPGYAILSPRGNVDENGMARFFRRLAEGVFDEEDLKARTTELATFIKGWEAEGDLPDPLYAVGYSNGANMAAALLFMAPETLSGAILLRPMLPFEPDVMPDLRGKRVMVIRGAEDPVIPAPSTDRLVEVLRKAGAELEVETLPCGHGLVAADHSRMAAWFNA